MDKRRVINPCHRFIRTQLQRQCWGILSKHVLGFFLSWMCKFHHIGRWVWSLKNSMAYWNARPMLLYFKFWFIAAWSIYLISCLGTEKSRLMKTNARNAVVFQNAYIFNENSGLWTIGKYIISIWISKTR